MKKLIINIALIISALIAIAIAGCPQETQQVVELGESCGGSVVCVEGISCIASICSNGAIGSGCTDSNDCDNSMCTASRCSDGSAGSGCDGNSNCMYACIDNICTDGSPGVECTGHTNCIHGCINGVCTDGQIGSGCELNSNCIDEYCMNLTVYALMAHSEADAGTIEIA